jgi:hypothetical protein
MARLTPEGQAAQAAGCTLSVLLTGVAFIALSRIVPMLFAGILSAFVVLPVLASLIGVWIRHISRPRTEEEERRREAHEAILFMNNALKTGKLHRRVDRAAGLLLEECARHWQRVQDALSGAFWEDRDLPAHWKQIRDQSLSAANRAMDDIIVMLRPVLESRQHQTSAQEFIGDILESFFNVDTSAPIEPLPAVYLPARDIAQKLVQLADEVEETSHRAASDASFREHYSSTTQIDQVLSELRAIKQAETELHQELGPTDSS